MDEEMQPATVAEVRAPRQKDIHSHQCGNCWHIWRHDAYSKKTLADNTAAHTCPKCGAKQFYRYEPVRQYS